MAWRSGRVVSLCQLWRRASLMHRSGRLSPTRASTRPAFATAGADPPRLSTGGAFTNEYPASNVSCHRRGTVNETSGSRHRLANPRNDSLSQTATLELAFTLAIRTTLAPNSLRTVLLAIRNAFRRAMSLRDFHPQTNTIHQGCPHKVNRPAHPFAQLVVRDTSSKAPRFRSS